MSCVVHRTILNGINAINTKVNVSRYRSPSTTVNAVFRFLDARNTISRLKFDGYCMVVECTQTCIPVCNHSRQWCNMIYHT
ncbi:hypothetical protein D3C73_985060 [compost metagenome]